jgi:hypothetical protein
LAYAVLILCINALPGAITGVQAAFLCINESEFIKINHMGWVRYFSFLLLLVFPTAEATHRA